MSRARGRRPSSSVPLEKVEQAHLVQLYESFGGKVYQLGTRRKRGERCPHCKGFVPNTDHGTHQTPGVSDLLVFLPTNPRLRAGSVELVFHEVKRAKGGRLSPDQQAFGEWCIRACQAHVVGGLDAGIAFLISTGRASRTQFAHYRVRQEVSQ